MMSRDRYRLAVHKFSDARPNDHCPGECDRTPHRMNDSGTGKVHDTVT